MNSKLTNVIVFAAGAAIGSLATWKLLNMRYEQRIQEEVQSVKETFAEWAWREDSDESSPEADSKDDEEDCTEEDPYVGDDQDRMMDRFEYEAELQRLKYTSVDPDEKGGVGTERVEYAPYVIDPSDYGDKDHDVVSLTYYADGVVDDDYWNIVQNVEELVGDDFMNHFDDDTVFIRNDVRKTDYEITRINKTYAEYHGESPYGNA